MDTTSNQFGYKVRVRVCGLCLYDGKLILIRHQGLGETGNFWSPPGGGVEFGESLTSALKREFKEECELEIEEPEFLFIHEFRTEKLHAVELFFKVSSREGIPQLGSDPELDGKDQMLQELKMFSIQELNEIPNNQKHQIFGRADNFEGLFALRGHFKSENYSIK